MSEYQQAVEATKKARDDNEQRAKYRFGRDTWDIITERVWPKVYNYILSLSRKGISFAKIHDNCRTSEVGKAELIEYIKIKGFRIEETERGSLDPYNQEFIIRWGE